MADDEPEDADAEEEQTADADEEPVENEETEVESEDVESGESVDEESEETGEADAKDGDEEESEDTEAAEEAESEDEADSESDESEDTDQAADDADEDKEPEEDHPIQLGTGEDVEGVPLAQVSARLMWGIERSQIRRREGDTVIRTPDGPRELGDILDEIDLTYFEKRQEFEEAVRDVIGTGPIPTAGE